MGHHLTYSAFTAHLLLLLTRNCKLSFRIPFSEKSDWDHFLSIDLSSTNLSLNTAADFLRNRDFANLVTESDIPTPTHLMEQALCFCRNICALLLSHKVCKSIVDSLFFDEANVRHGKEEDYSSEWEMLCDFFVESKWISSNAKPLIYREYCFLCGPI